MSFTYVLYELSRHPEAQQDLRRELLALTRPFHWNLDGGLDGQATRPGLDDAMPSSGELCRLPLLNAVIKEGLRLRNNPPSMDPRVTPGGRRSDVGPLKNLPPGIRVSGYTCLLHRHSDLFPNPLAWDPSRWLGGGSSSGGGALLAFGSGSRACIGEHMAMERT